MSDNIPIEIQLDIIKRLPIKSIIRFRSVSKDWKKLIDGSEFIIGYTKSKAQPHHILVRYADTVHSEQKYLSIVDDDTFPQQKFAVTLPVSVNLFIDLRVVASSHGLFCFYGNYPSPGDGNSTVGKKMIVIWNPSIRRSVAIAVPNVLYNPYGTALGFGVCPETKDPKIVKITYNSKWKQMDSIPSQVEVFSLRSGAWRSLTRNLPRESIGFGCSFVVINQYMYWYAYDDISEDAGYRSYMIITFDMKSEEFTEVYLPDTLALVSLSISKLRESLVVLESGFFAYKPVYNVWIMNDGVPETLSKLYTVNPPGVLVMGLREFRNNGEPIVEVSKDSQDTPAALFVYEPNSRHIINDLGVYALDLSLSVCTYVESLLLLDQPAFTISN